VAIVQAATVDVVGFGKGTLKIIGAGSVLASVDLPLPWATKAQTWIMDKVATRGA
jgi:hypothetical protein